MKKLIRGLVIGDKQYIGSWTEYRQVMLSGQFGLIALMAFAVFIILDLIRQDYQVFPVFAVGIFLISLSLWFHRIGRHCLANSVLYTSLIVIVYLFTSSESPSNGGIVFYIPIAIGAFASFDYKHRKLAIMVAAFSCFMFMAATFVDFHFLPWRNYSEEETLLNMLIYFVVALPASMAAIYMLMRLNHRNAKRLVESNTALKKSNEELDRFIYSTSHDLRAPLTSVLGLINLSEKSNDVAELRMYNTMMRERIHALDSFIKDITDYARNGRTEVTRETIYLHNMAMEIWESLKFNQRAQKIQFEIMFDKELTIQTDPHRLRVILANLISNAIRYHDPSKEHQYIKLQCKRTDKSFNLMVEDNGQGIAKENHQKIFQMFFRANESSQGSGLGLYLVREAIAKLSGQVQLCSALSEGSTFTIKLPV